HLHLPVRVRAEGVARRRLPRRVERNQFARHLAGLLADAPGRALPLVAADLVDLRRRALRPDIPLHAVYLVGGNEQPVAALIFDKQVVTQIVLDLALDQPAIDADAVMDMDDEIVLAQVEDRRDRHAARHAPPRDDRPRAAEEFRVGNQVEAQVGDLEPGAQTALLHEQARRVLYMRFARLDRQIQFGADLADAVRLVGDEQHAALVGKPDADLIGQRGEPAAIRLHRRGVHTEPLAYPDAFDGPAQQRENQ